VCGGAVEVGLVDAVHGGVVLGQDHIDGNRRAASADTNLFSQIDGIQFYRSTLEIRAFCPQTGPLSIKPHGH
jgi:hypothetical protein